ASPSARGTEVRRPRDGRGGSRDGGGLLQARLSRRAVLVRLRRMPESGRPHQDDGPTGAAAHRRYAVRGTAAASRAVHGRLRAAPPRSQVLQRLILMSRMRAVLWDMDGTLVDSEKLWDTAMRAFYERLGGTLTPQVRAATIGGSAEGTMRIVYADLGLPADPSKMAATADWLHDYTADLFDQGLPWCEGARELLEALAIEGIPMALVTNTRRSLTERALNSIVHHYF